MFIKNPHLPCGDVNLFVVDKRLKNITAENVVFSFEHKDILEGINTHPDMTLCPLKNGSLVVAKAAYEYYFNLLSGYSLNIIKGENDIKKDYPFDISLNCVLIGDMLFHKIKYTDKAILKYCEKNNIKLINVNQGYTKCSTLIVDEKSVITSDASLYKIYKENGIDALYVDNSAIKINGFDHGFIGGCGGKISKNKMVFFGDIKKHPDFNKISVFLEERKVTYLSLFEGELFDYGSLIPLHTIF